MRQLNGVLAELAKIEATIAIKEPHPLKVVAAYPNLPPGQDTLNLPCFLNTWRPTNRYTLNPGGHRMRDYTIRAQLLVSNYNVDSDLYSQCATEMYEAFLEELAANVTLNGTVAVLRIRPSESEWQPGRLERAAGGLPYIGVEVLMDVTINDVVTVGP